MSRDLSSSKYIIVKVGSAVLVNDAGNGLDRGTFCRLVEELSHLHASGKKIILITSGAVALGRFALELPHHRRSLPELQAMAAVGQSLLMQHYENEFSHYGVKVAQVLLTRDDLDNRRRYVNAKRTLEALWELGVLPIINENDTITTEEIRFGDNDSLAARVAMMLRTDLLMILSDIDAVYTADPKIHPDATPIHEITALDERLDVFVGESKSLVGTGGMKSKIRAARQAARMGIATIIMSGKAVDRLRLSLTSSLGSLLLPCDQAQSSHTMWLMSLHTRGSILCDEGAAQALIHKGRSLLPKGIVGVKGKFHEGELVEICHSDGKPFARGIALYNGADIDRIKGAHASEIEAILGFHVSDTVVHRNELVLLDSLS